MFAFDFQLRTRFICGPNKIDSLGSGWRVGGSPSVGRQRPGHRRRRACCAGNYRIAQSRHRDALFDGVTENPTTENVEAGLATAQRYQPEVLIGLGGGSSARLHKGINFLYSNGGRMQDYWGVERPRAKCCR